MAAQQAAAPVRAPGNRFYHALMAGCGVLAAVLFGGMAVLVCADVFMRNLGLGTLQWSVEMTEYMLMVATFAAAPWLLYAGDHINIDILLRTLKPASRRLLGILTDCCGLVISLVLAWQCVVVTRDAAEQGSVVFKVLIFPEWWLNLPMTFACVMTALEFGRRLRASLFAAGEA